MPCNFHNVSISTWFYILLMSVRTATLIKSLLMQHFILFCSMCKNQYVQICNKYILPFKTDTFPFDFHFSVLLRNVYLFSHVLLLEVFFLFIYLFCKDFLVYLLCFDMLIFVLQSCGIFFFFFFFLFFFFFFSKCFLTALWVSN